MSELKIDQIQNVLKTFGLEDSDFERLTKEDVEDFSPFVQKVQTHIKSELMSDTSFTDEIIKPYKDAPIGKENQLKKEVRKYFGLEMTEDELKKTPFRDILTKADETRKATVGTDVDKYKSLYMQTLEEKEALEAKIPTIQQEVEGKYMAKIREKETEEELVKLSAIEAPQVQKENLHMFVNAMLGYAHKSGHKIVKDDSGAVRVFDAEGLPLKDSNGHVMKVKDYVKNFANGIVSNVAPKSVTAIPQTNQKAASLLSMLGTGL